MFERQLKRLKKEGLFREIKDRESCQGRVIKLQDREYLNFSSNDYLGFASDGMMIKHATETMETLGVGAGSSRLLAGGTFIHGKLEETIARLKGSENAVVFNSGYAANIGAIPAFTGENDAIFSDELNHASIIDGCRLSKARKFRYKHCDVSDLRNLVKKTEADNKIIITETVFSMDGDIAPLQDIYDLCRDEAAILYIDDAHGTGVLGQGRGALTHFGIEASEFVVQMGTLSKAFGSFGAFVAADHNSIEYLINRARSLIYSTALPAAIMSSANAAIEIIMSDTGRVEKLWANIKRIHRDLDSTGIHKGNSSTQIIPLIFDSLVEAETMSCHLSDGRIYAPVIRPPTVKKPRVRISVTALHTEDDIGRLVEVLKKCFHNR